MKLAFNLIIVTLTVLIISAVKADHHFVEKLRLQTGETVVVAEGELEPRSIGSFTVRLFGEAAEPGWDTTYYLSGLLHERDGVIEEVVLEDLDGDLTQEIVVIVRSVGSGAYLSAHAFRITDGELGFWRSVADLPKDSAPVSVLRETINGL